MQNSSEMRFGTEVFKHLPLREGTAHTLLKKRSYMD